MVMEMLSLKLVQTIYPKLVQQLLAHKIIYIWIQSHKVIYICKFQKSSED